MRPMLISAFRLLDAGSLATCKSTSIDYAVMEHTTRAAVVPAMLGWSDVGSWDALWDLDAKDDKGNVTSGDIVLDDVRNSYVRGDSKLIALLGVDDLVVVSTPDAVLVARRDRAQDVKRLVEALPQNKRQAPAPHRRVDQTWGSSEVIDAGEDVRIRRLVMTPGAQISQEQHGRGAGHWIVVAGMARVTLGGRVIILHESESIGLPRDMAHSIENLGESDLLAIEICSDFGSREDIDSSTLDEDEIGWRENCSGLDGS